MVSFDPLLLLVSRIPSFMPAMTIRFLSWLLLTAGASPDIGDPGISANKRLYRTSESEGADKPGKSGGGAG